MYTYKWKNLVPNLKSCEECKAVLQQTLKCQSFPPAHEKPLTLQGQPLKMNPNGAKVVVHVAIYIRDALINWK